MPGLMPRRYTGITERLMPRESGRVLFISTTPPRLLNQIESNEIKMDYRNICGQAFFRKANWSRASTD